MEFKVSYYDAAQREILEAHEKSPSINRLVQRGLEISADELMVHTMFSEQMNEDGFRTYEELAAQAGSRVGWFESYFNFGEDGLFAHLPPSRVEKRLTQGIGEGIAIIAMNRIYDLTEADWERIGERNDSKTLDHQYELASTGQRFVQVEGKGTVLGLDGFGRKTASISRAKSSILAKKEESSSPIESAPCDRFGVITAIPSEPGAIPDVYLIDPAGVAPDIAPQKYKLLSRLSYYERRLSYVSKFHFLMVLRNRINAIHDSEQFEDLDGIKLVGQDGTPFGFPQTRDSLVTSRGGEVFGRVLPVSQEEALFIGFEQRLFYTLIGQSFQDVNSFKIHRHEVVIDTFVTTTIPGADGRSRLRVRGRAHLNSAGIAFGQVDLSRPYSRRYFRKS
ncbi:hypothetical protein FIV42_01805 [Persicimonas caeni]|uniref:Uncharacterized protein n=1 Tax=Persicimonas caeni TaxID=2292766 RepID=A0A4Y6PMH3_PERCE|nr:hypothetical protein [Persicimonas caeni]QDG49514.1 hypothetical protein FIV42_01805 [Persicimonas caeni]QED30735.1 hypothetical protein FRD00_01800 [Persicimonas caeni]